MREHGGELLLPHAVMVEGNVIAPLPHVPEHAPATISVEDDDEPRLYGLLEGVIGSTAVVGVPDVVTYDPTRSHWRLADYKTSKTVLSPDTVREDAQLTAYLVLLRQTGIIPAGATVEMGLLYLSDQVEAVWVNATNLQGAVPRRLVQQVEQTRTLVEAEIFMPVKGLLNGYADRCAGCVFAHGCDA